MLASLLCLAVPALLQQTRSFAILLDATVDQATPLFSPVGESAWAPGWHPAFIHASDGGEHAGTIFTTEGHGRARLWLLTEYDATNGRVAYVVVDPELMVTEISIRIRPEDARHSKATITYRRSALTQSANDLVAVLDADWAEAQSREWQAAINGALKKAAGRRE